MKSLDKAWIVSMIAGLSCALLLGMALVWLNIDRVDTAYSLRQMQKSLHETQAHVDKLRVERDNLASPRRLQERAKTLGLRPAKAQQLRRLAEH